MDGGSEQGILEKTNNMLFIKKCILALFCILSIHFSYGQERPKEYDDLITKALALYMAKDYKASGFAYSSAFKVNDWKGSADDRYNAACAWALANYPDSAFFNLERISTKSGYKDYNHIITDEDLTSLHNDKRWQPLLDLIKKNKEKAEINLNKPLALQLDSIYSNDQNNRLKSQDIEKKFGSNSKEMIALWGTINKTDSIDLIKVKFILDKYGWLGEDVIGEKGNSTLFLVIQHADLKTQETYLPMMKKAVEKGNALPSQLALLVDRIEMRNERPQIYGSQVIGQDGKYSFYKIIDEPNVNKRRAEVGLEPLDRYAKFWNIDYKVPER